MEAAFLFALVWSVGCTGDGDSRRKFDSFLRSMLSGIIPDGYLVRNPKPHLPLLAR